MHTSILLIEDSPHKSSRILDLLNSLGSNFTVSEAKSFSSASKLLIENSYDLVLADISLPTFDKSPTESGGRFRPYAGLEIARRIGKKSGVEKVVFITQYESFSDKGASRSFSELEAMLANEIGRNFLGMIFFDSSEAAWKEALRRMVEAYLK